MSSHASAASRTTSRWASLACPSTDYLSSQQPFAHFINPSPRWCSSLHVSRSSMKAAHARTQLVPIRANAPSTTQWIPIALDSHSAFHSLTRAFALFLTPSRLATAFLPSTTRPPHTAHCAPFTRTPSHPLRPQPQRRQVLALQPPRRQRRRGRRELSLLHDRPERHAMRRARQALQAALRHLGAPLEVPRVPPPRRHRRPHQGRRRGRWARERLPVPRTNEQRQSVSRLCVRIGLPPRSFPVHSLSISHTHRIPTSIHIHTPSYTHPPLFQIQAVDGIYHVVRCFDDDEVRQTDR